MATILWNVFLGILILVLLVAVISIIGAVVWLGTEAIREYKIDKEFYEIEKEKRKKKKVI